MPPDWKGKRCFILNSQKEFPVIAGMITKTIKRHGSFMIKEYSLGLENIDTFITQHVMQPVSLGYSRSPRNILKYWQQAVYCWFSCYLLGTAQMSKNLTESKRQPVKWGVTTWSNCHTLKCIAEIKLHLSVAETDTHPLTPDVGNGQLVNKLLC